VMDGEIDEFLRQYLLFNVKNERAKKWIKKNKQPEGH
jgi:hypothetical protein